ncbi:TatD family hydrolase [Geopsychrobacter electrodiphilus]|uniref:TatD family hydrolase n=1 Tax=Geopsychrobacter electrodiphilus TaxID=225196 RepID=UPI00035F9395|nr:TatD family hydrolase [Geopsychrobacter electrodiphilus]
MNEKLLTLIDSHAHLDSSQFGDELEQILQRADEAGIKQILTIGCDLQSSARSVTLAAQYAQVHAAVGIHPHDAGEATAEGLALIESLLAAPKVVAVGEIGLDFFRDHSPRDQQRTAFRQQIRLARKHQKPIIVHDREAHAEVLQILHEEHAADCGGVLHCFSGDITMARACLDLGFYLSFPGTISYPKNEAQREVVAAVPIDRMMIETDCPYLAPVPHRGKRNEPAYVRYTAEKLAEIKGLTLSDVARVTSRNVYDLFGIGAVDQQTKIAYQIRDSLYLNITNRCTNSCVFCAKFDDFVVKGHELKLDHEPDIEELKRAIGDPKKYREVVFCGYGEPLLRLELICELSAWLKTHQVKVRINTDGQANLVHGRNILPDLAGKVDALSVSLNAPDATQYQKLCRSKYPEIGYEAVKDFLKQAPTYIPEVIASAVSYPGVDIAACRKVAEDLGVEFRAREYNEVG